MLLAAALLPVLAPRATNPVAAVITAPQPTGDIILSATIERPATAVPIPALPAQTVVTTPGATVESLAVSDHSDASAIRWANALSGVAEPQPGSTLLLPPSPGALVRVQPGERPSQFARRMALDPGVVLDYNALSSDAPRLAGTYLQVPLAAAPRGALIGRFFTRVGDGVPAIDDRGGADTFPYGQCTYYVALHRDVTWAGDAWSWFAAANGIRPEGRVPVEGAIVVFHSGWAGHVAVVESVNPDGSFVVSEMNFYGNGGGWGRVDHRLISGAGLGLVTGFIY